MKLAEAAGEAPAHKRWARLLLSSATQLPLATLYLALPALYNRFPILYPDSMTYLGDGPLVARAVFLHRFSDYYGMRSFIYSLGILPFHWNRTAWPIVALQCFLVAFVLRLVVRAIVPRLADRYFLPIVLLLSLVTSVGWFSGLILPDILGALVYLAFFLLVFARDTISRLERYALYVIAWWGIASHITHLLLSAALCLLFAAMLALRREPLRRILLAGCETAGIVALAAASLLGLNAYLYGVLSLNGERPPFLMARVIADGPGQWYLQQHCGQLNWAICARVGHLTNDVDNFLWAPDGIWESASEDDQERMLQEEMPLVLATFRAYPQAQLARSAINVWQQLGLFGLDDLDPSSWTREQFDTVLPSARAHYLAGRQAQNQLPLDDLTGFQFWVVTGSLGLIAILLPLVAKARPARLASLCAVIAFVELENAALTGPLSMPEDRFEARVIWLVPFLACLFAVVCVDRWQQRRQAAIVAK